MRRDLPLSLVQVAPPGQGGVMDHLLGLKAAWSCAGQESAALELSQELARARPLPDRIEEASGGQGGPLAVVLHFSGYGYGSRGICFWLLDELRALRRRRGNELKLIVVFHEIFADGPPWRSAFWVSGLQKRIARSLAGMADAIWTNTDRHASWLRANVRQGKQVTTRAVFSNVGEPALPSAWNGRAARAVVFGLASTRQRLFDQLAPHTAALQRLGVEELVEVGSGAASIRLPAGLPCCHRGRLESAELGALLQSSRYGLLAHPSRDLGKSGVFAAYLAHGCVAIGASPPDLDSDGLVGGRDYLHLASLASPSTPQADAIAANGHRWYVQHGRERQAEELLELARSTVVPAAR